VRAYTFGDDPRFRTDPNLVYVSKTRRALWEQRGQEFAETITPETRATFAEFYPLQVRVVGMLKQQGVKMLAGSDLGGGWVIPGYALHQEFRELAAAGLQPLEILQMRRSPCATNARPWTLRTSAERAAR
jgi:imidazolonepropionase-like amidohydrolase